MLESSGFSPLTFLISKICSLELTHTLMNCLFFHNSEETENPRTYAFPEIHRPACLVSYGTEKVTI